jgi:hypothetical protein
VTAPCGVPGRGSIDVTALVAAASAPLGGHLWHVVAGLAVAAVSLAAVVWDWLAPDGDDGVAGDGERRGKARRPISPPLSRVAILAMSAAALSAALIHTRVSPQHFAESIGYGAFFVVVALAQASYAVVVLARPSRPIVTAGATGNAAVVVLWLVTRLVAVPLGPDAGEVEGFGVLDVLASALEAAIVVAACFALWAGTPRARQAWDAYPRPAKAGAAAVVLGTAVVCGLARVS